jgi:hypothetical protein
VKNVEMLMNKKFGYQYLDVINRAVIHNKSASCLVIHNKSASCLVVRNEIF